MKSKRHKIKTYEHRGISIREVRDGYFMADYMRDGKRERVCFNSLPDAERHCEDIAAKIHTEGTSALALTAEQRADAVKALREANGKTTLHAAVAFWMRHYGVADGVTVAEIGQRWLAALKAQGCRPTTLVERSHKVARLSADFGERSVASLTRDDLTDWLSSKNLTGMTWDGYRRAYCAMFQFAVKEKVVEYNAAAAISHLTMDEKMPTPLSVDATAAILATAAKYAPIMVPTLAVQFFAGLRPGEAMGLLWTDIDFKQKILRVRPEISKVRRARIIENLKPNLIEWLRPYRKTSGPIGIQTPSQFNFYMFRKPIGEPYVQEGIAKAERPKDERPKGIAKAAGVAWIADGPRKSFASAHFATNGDAGKLAGVLGHTSGVDILYRHYRGLMTKADARRYWNIQPASKSGSIIKVNFKKAAG
ncbi:MAG TPA: hypothetical protein DCM68_05085 [Verrucomicrobia bacterium]|nr:hypothetical protein [Verrucomicrobiota bacterium]